MQAAEIRDKPWPQTQSQSPQMVKATTTVTVDGGPLLILSGLTLTGTVMALTVALPLLVIHIAVALLITGFFFGIVAIAVPSWIYRSMIGKKPLGPEEKVAAADDKARLGGPSRDSLLEVSCEF